jgi:peptidoglycan hydrolase-like protein with peptidoglycan-binding domain
MPPPEVGIQLNLRILKQLGDPVPEGDVKILQFLLLVLAGAYSPFDRALRPSDGVNGLFDDKTTNWVKQFQRREGLRDDGVVGKNTWTRLLELWIARFTEGK